MHDACNSTRGRAALATLVGAALIMVGGPRVVVAGAPGRAELLATRDALETKYSADLAELAAWCAAHQHAAEAKQVREWLPRREPNKLYVFVLPEALVAPSPTVEKPEPDPDNWWPRFVKLRRAMADSLFELAGKALTAHQPALAYELIRQTIRENPDHEPARLALGYEKFNGRWVSAHDAHRLALGQVFHDQYGWIPAADVPRYDAGQRKYQGNWVSIEDDARHHANIQTGWHIETEHFIVTTNHSLEAGVKLAKHLERLHEIWQQVFVTYWLSDADLKKAYEGAPPRRYERQHAVLFYRDRDEYNTALRPQQPLIGMTLGIYLFDTQRCNFFAGADQNEHTIDHEATHQLFQETRASARDLGRRNNFWVVEAVACYMESLEAHDGYYTLGGFDEGRVPAARERLLDDHFYVPLAELVTYGRDALQHDARLPKLYSQSSGLAMFLMHYNGGRYRQALVDYLLAVYGNKADALTLAKLCGVKYNQLDEQYDEFMKQSVLGR